MALVIKNLPVNAADINKYGFDPWVQKIPVEEHGNPLQCSYLENKDRGSWRATVHRVAESGTTEAT